MNGLCFRLQIHRQILCPYYVGSTYPTLEELCTSSAVLAVSIHQSTTTSLNILFQLKSRLCSHQPCILYRLPHRHRAEYHTLYVVCGPPTSTLRLANHQTPAHSTTIRDSFSLHLRSPGPNCPFSTPHLASPSSSSPFNHNSTDSSPRNVRRAGRIGYDGSCAFICTSGPALCCACF